MNRNTAIALSIAVVAVIGVAGLALWNATTSNQTAINVGSGGSSGVNTPEIPSTGNEPGGSEPSSAPTVDTTAATDVSGTSATLNGRLSANGGATTYWFEYSTDSTLGNALDATIPNALVGSGTASVSASATVNNLTPNTRYFYRLVARNPMGAAQGDIVEFRTLSR